MPGLYKISLCINVNRVVNHSLVKFESVDCKQQGNLAVCSLQMRLGRLPKLLAQAIQIKLVMDADGVIVGPSVRVHCMGQGVIAASSLHQLQRSAACELQHMRTSL